LFPVKLPIVIHTEEDYDRAARAKLNAMPDGTDKEREFRRWPKPCSPSNCGATTPTMAKARPRLRIIARIELFGAQALILLRGTLRAGRPYGQNLRDDIGARTPLSMELDMTVEHGQRALVDRKRDRTADIRAPRKTEGGTAPAAAAFPWMRHWSTAPLG
jgi:hypothetical protein